MRDKEYGCDSSEINLPYIKTNPPLKSESKVSIKIGRYEHLVSIEKKYIEKKYIEQRLQVLNNKEESISDTIKKLSLWELVKIKMF